MKCIAGAWAACETYRCRFTPLSFCFFLAPFSATQKKKTTGDSDLTLGSRGVHGPVPAQETGEKRSSGGGGHKHHRLDRSVAYMKKNKVNSWPYSFFVTAGLAALA